MFPLIRKFFIGSFEKIPIYNTEIITEVAQSENCEPAYPDTKDDNKAVEPLREINREEKSDNYAGVITILSEKWRVIECKNRTQWIIQFRKGSYKGQPAWKGKSYCRTRSGLLQCIKENAGIPTTAIDSKLAELPERLS